jgi:hypothetical protein
MPGGVARILIERPDKWQGMLLPWNVSIDGQNVGKIKNGTTGSFEVEPGSHIIRVNAVSSRPGKEPHTVTVGDGEVVQLRGSINSMNKVRLERADPSPLASPSGEAGQSQSQSPFIPSVQPSSARVIEVSRSEVPMGEELLHIDNSQSSSHSVRVKRLTKEWTRSYSVEIDKSSTISGGAGLAFHIVELKAQAEQAVSHKYSARADERETYEDEVTITVAARTKSEIVFSWKEIHQNGYVVFGEEEGAPQVPFDIVMGVTFDQRQVDVDS